jgi:hypothetical protein
MTPFLVLVILFSVFVGFAPTLTAQLGIGKAGIFTVTDENCTASCSWIGKFTSNDGTDTRYDISLVGGGQALHVFDQIPAVDTGDGADVQATGGAGDWTFVLVATLVALAILGFWARAVPLRSRRARKLGVASTPTEAPTDLPGR